MPNVKISQLPYVGKTGFTSNDIVPFVNYINPTGTTSETKIDDIKDYVLDNTFIQNIIKVGKGGNIDFTTVSDAVNSITGSSSTNRYVIQIGPGFYIEPEINLIGKEYVNLVGSEINSTIILPDLNTNTIFTLGTNNQLSFLTISGATSGIGISCPDCGDFSLIHKVSLFDNDTQISITSSVVSTQFYGEYVGLNGDYTYGVYVTASNSFPCYVSFENYFNETLGPKPTIANYCSGLGSSLSIQGGAGFGIGITGSEYLRIENGADAIISGVNLYTWDYAIRNPNNGGACTFDIDGVSILGSSTYDLSIENPNTSGTVQGSLSHQQINNLSQNVYWGFLDHVDGEFDVTRKISVTFKDGTHTDLSTLLFEGNTMGVLEGGVISIVSGLTFSISQGYGYLESIIDNSVIKRYDWNNTQHTLPPNSNQYIYINNNGILSNTGTRPNSIYNIVLGRVVTNSTDIIIIDASPLNASHTSNLYGDLFTNALGPIYDTGSIVTENVTPYHLDVTGGDYFYSTSQYLPSGGSDITFTMYYGDGTTGWTTSATTEVINGYDDGSGTISPLPTTAFTKHTLYVVGQGVNEQYFLVLGQNQYPTLVQTENGLLPTPPTYFEDSVTQIASIYIQQGSSNIIEIEDIRPVIGFKAGGVNASSLHGNLLGLNADDHTQYLLVDGSRAMEGNINMGGNDIYSANTVTTNTISATTYQNLPFSGTSDYLPRWVGANGLGNSQIRDDGSTIGVGYSPTSLYKFWIVDYNTGTTTSFVVSSSSLSGNSKIGILGESGALQYGTGVKGTATSSIESIGIYGRVNKGTLGIGVKGIATNDEFSTITTGIGGYFEVFDSGYGIPTNAYSVQLKDGTEGTNKVLVSKTSDGKANWSDILTGLTNVESTTISATTYLNLPSFVNMLFGHSSLNPVDATTYYIGGLSTLSPSTTNRDSWSIVSQYTGQVTEVSIVSNFVGGSNENSTMTINNLSGGTSQTISSTLQFTSGSSTTILSETFLGTTQPAGWTSVFVTYAGSYAGLTGTTSTLTSPVFDGSTYTSLVVSLDVATFGAGTDGPVLVEYSLDNGVTFATAGVTVTPTASSPYIPTSVTVPTTSSQMKIRFSVNPGGTKGKRIRNVVISAISFSPTINNNFVLGTPLLVTSGDKLQVRWTTPTWSANPTTVTTMINLKIKL